MCCNGAGTWLNPRNLERWWGTTQEIGYRHSIGFGDLRLHELRHTQATQLIGAGVDFKTVQTRLGHADVSLTINTYTHAIPANDRKAADLIASITGTPKAPAVKAKRGNSKRRPRVQISPRISPADSLQKKTGQRQSSDLRILGSPYRIRTGDLRLERAAS